MLTSFLMKLESLELRHSHYNSFLKEQPTNLVSAYIYSVHIIKLLNTWKLNRCWYAFVFNVRSVSDNCPTGKSGSQTLASFLNCGNALMKSFAMTIANVKMICWGNPDGNVSNFSSTY